MQLCRTICKGLESPLPIYKQSVVELSTTQWDRFNSNSILVEDIVMYTSVDNQPLVSYNKITYGKNIKKPKRRQCMSLGKQLHYKQPAIANMDGGYFFITTQKKDILQLNKDVLIVDGSSQTTGKGNGGKYCPSGIVILMFCKLQNIKQAKGYKWGSHQAKFLKVTKNNIMDCHSSHFGSTGSYYSFGNRGNYGMIDGSSVASYATKSYKNERRNTLTKINADVLEEMAACELISAVNGMSKIIHNIKNFIAPTLNVAYQSQKVLGEFNMRKVSISECGMWQSSICINGQTTTVHTENDCSYTVITVPEQDIEENPVDDYIFLFEIKKGETIGINMCHGISFFFAGKYLSHRQAHNESTSVKNSLFVNIASYGNEMLYNHIKKTINRKADMC